MERAKDRRPGLGRRWWAGAAVSALVVATGVVGVSLPAAAVSGTVTGTVFRDFNGNGLMDTSGSSTSPAIDERLAGINVTAYDASGAEVASATTGGDGTYELSYEPSTDDTRLRVEFDVPDGWYPSARGTSTVGVNSGTTVEFVEDGDVANLGVAHPDDYTQPDPPLAVAVQRGVTNIGLPPPTDVPSEEPVPDVPLPSGDLPTIGTVPYDVSGEADMNIEATHAQTGSLWGMAAYGTTHLFSGSVFKRHAPLGPGGLGAVYLTEVGGDPDAEVWTTIPEAGEDPRGDESDPSYDWFQDEPAAAAVGTIGLGDVDLSSNGETLYVVNLGDRQVYAVPVDSGDGSAPVAGEPEPIALPLDLPGAPACEPDQVRPFGITTTPGDVWVTLTCTGPQAGDLQGYVYRYDEATGAFDEEPAVEVPLHGYERGVAFGSELAELHPIPASFVPWTDDPLEGRHGTAQGTYVLVTPQPLLADVEFDRNGDVLVGVKDRLGDQSTYHGGGFDDQLVYHDGMSAGDLLRACGDHESGWELEDNGGCGDRIGSGVDNAQGPGGGEFFTDDYALQGPTEPVQQQVSLGGLLQVPGFRDVVATAHNPGEDANAGGYRMLHHADGTIAEAVSVYGDTSMPNEEGYFGNAAGVGDMAAMQEPGPLEIGGRLWLDSDEDGVQDADEEPIESVTVCLFDGDGNELTRTTTSTRGEYRFNDGSPTDGLSPETAYSIGICYPGDFEYGPLQGLSLTEPNVGDNDAIDSDAKEGDEGFPVVSTTTGPGGQNDHTLDVGFR